VLLLGGQAAGSIVSMDNDGARECAPPLERRLPLATLAAIGTGLGGLAFFTFMGGAITVARFRGAGLSGTKAVALVPKSDLLATGAQALLLPTLIGVAALVPFVLLAPYRKGRRVLLGVYALVGFGGAVAIIWTQWPVQHWAGDEKLAVAALFFIAVSGYFAVDALAQDAELPKPTTATPAADDEPGSDTTTANGGDAETDNPISQTDPGSRGPATVLLFLVVALFVAVALYGRGYADPTVHPMAVLRANGQPWLSGIYVGESDSRVWIGQVRLDPPGSNHGKKSAGRIIELPRSAVSDIAIGASMQLKDAVSKGHPLLRALHREHVRRRHSNRSH
jgi:hypothetical protein